MYILCMVYLFISFTYEISHTYMVIIKAYVSYFRKSIYMIFWISTRLSTLLRR